jgi:hypothetical protein
MPTKRLISLFVIHSSHLFILSKEEDAMKDPDTPKGAIALMIVYAVIILALWSNVYLTLLSRGATQ